jgi:hypothetical protein
MKFRLTPWLAAFICSFSTLCVSGSGFYLSVFQPEDRVAIVGNSFADQMRKYSYFETLVRYYHPEYNLSFRNLGWAGDTLADRARPENFPSERETLKNFGASKILICFGMADSLDGAEGLDEFSKQLEALCDRYSNEIYNGSEAPGLVLISPTAIESSPGVENVEVPNLVLASYVEAIRSFAAERSIPYVDLFTSTKALMKDVNGSKLTSNGVLLNAYGYWVVSYLMVEAMMRDEIYFDATAEVGDLNLSYSWNSGPRDFKQLGGNYSWKTVRSSWDLPPPAGSKVHDSIRKKRGKLVASSLGSGIYSLELNGKLVGRGTNEEWANGIHLEDFGTNLVLEELRQEVVDKNAQFVFSWKSLNQVHIVGERKKSPSGRAIPGELIQFHELAEAKEAQLKQQFSALAEKESTWKLKRDLD